MDGHSTYEKGQEEMEKDVQDEGEIFVSCPDINSKG